MSGIAILDSTILTNFALVRRPDLVMSLWQGKVCTTPAVMGEYLSASDRLTFPPECWIELPILELTAQEETLAQQLPARLGAGERTCIAVAIQRGGLLVSDDLDARRIARIHALLRSGMLGILITSTQQNLLPLDEANQLLTRMIAAGYHSPMSELKSKKG